MSNTQPITNQQLQPENEPKQSNDQEQRPKEQEMNEQEKKQAQEAVERLMQGISLEDSSEQSQNLEVEPRGEILKSSQKGSEMAEETKEFVEISRTNIPFGKGVLFPGSIEEVDVAIGLREDVIEDNEGNDPLMLRVIAKCNNSQFDALDQYVFSVRSNDRFEYFEEVRFKIRKRERAQVKVAVKIPPVKENYTLEGVLEIQLQNLVPVCLPITARCEVPEISCMKNLFKAEEGCSMIKVPAKKNQIRMPPIPFKNLSGFNFTLQVQAITNENFANRPYDIVTQNFVNCQANMQFFVNLQLKENMNYKGVLPLRDTIRKVLILKIKNSSVYFNYPLEINVFESTNSGGMS